jgi:hypothetical protein
MKMNIPPTLRVSPVVRGILLIQKIQFFILATHFLMSTPIDSLFHLLFALKYHFSFFYYIIANT